MLSANEDVDEASARRAAAAIVSDDERLTSWLPLLDDVLPLHFMPTEVTEQMSSQARAASLRVLVVGFAMRLTRIKPLLLIADDLHWFDGASASLLLALISARVPGLMVLIGTRPLGLGAALATRETLAQAELIELDALSPAEVGVLISGRMANDRCILCICLFVGYNPRHLQAQAIRRAFIIIIKEGKEFTARMLDDFIRRLCNAGILGHMNYG